MTLSNDGHGDRPQKRASTKMFATFKMIGLASALSAGVVTAYDLPQLRDTVAPAGKTFYDRVLPSEEIQAPVTLAYAASLPETTGSVKEVRQDGKGDDDKDQQVRMSFDPGHRGVICLPWELSCRRGSPPPWAPRSRQFRSGASLPPFRCRE